MPVSLKNDTNTRTTPKRNREKNLDVKSKTPGSDNVDDKENGSPKSDESLTPKTPTRKPRRSMRNSPRTPQPTITDMFAKKRIRSPKENEESETQLQKKIKVEIEQTQPIVINSKDSERLKSPDKDKEMEIEEITKQNDKELNNSNNKNEENSNEDNESKPDIRQIYNDTSNMETDTSNREDFKKDEIKNSVEDLNSPKSKVLKDDSKNEDTEVEKCKTCFQILNNSDLLFYQGHPQDAIEEFIALTNEKLVLAAGDEGDIMERPQTNATFYSVYDKDGHLCPIDAGLIESDVRLYLSGYLKSICSESPDIDEEAVPVKDVGPIIEWYIHGFDGGKKNCITLSTEFGEYNLMLPSAEYTPLMNNLYEKIWISKVTVEYLEEYHYLQPSYEDLLEVIREATIPELNDMRMSEDILHKHAQFVCDQVVSLEADDDEDPPLITLPCMRELIKLMGIRFGKQKTRTKIEYKKKSVKPVWTKATTTPLVRKTFETFFSNQLDKADKELVLRRKRCGICESCQQPDCGECSACRAMAKFGGAGKTKKACVRRLCPNMAVQAAEDSDPEDEEEYRELAEKVSQDKIEDSVPVKLTAGSKNITWIDEPIKTDASKIYYEKVTIDNMTLKIGDFVMVETSSPNIPALVTRIVYMWKEPMTPKAGYFHGEVFFRASDTVLGEVSDPQEVFLADRCCHGAPLSSILRLAHVNKIEQPSNWFQLGGKEVEKPETNDDGKTYFYQKFYERFTARFEDIPDDPQCPNDLRKHRFCPSCERKTKRDTQNIPKVFSKLDVKSELITESNRTEWTMVKWREFEYKKGCGVFLKPGTFKFKNMLSGISTIKAKSEKVDESIYTEYYRKSDNLKAGSNFDTMEPFCVGHIAAVSARGDGPLIVPQDIYLKVNIMYRPENTTNRFPQHEDLNLVYWSEELKEVPFSSVMGPCHLIYEKNIPSDMTTSEWLEVDPDRFYFRDSFDKSTGKIVIVQSGTTVGRMDKVKDKGKGKGKGKSDQAQNKGKEDLKIRPLRTLDVFAGCGGLSEGLHQAGVADCRWAIENTEAAAHAYSLNNKNCIVFNEDCNGLLNDAMSGVLHSAGGLRLPIQGDVELLCGGPPCQGFSGMNRFNSREYSNFKNSLVASYLSYCDFYRPKYFILENVRNFVAYKKGMVLKLTLRSLLDMGYQCTFGILQAGNYGVPQTRRRLIILASAPGYKLPLYPEPTHVFSRRACTLTAAIDGKRFSSNIQWDESAPRRTCTIRDAMSDLPEIKNGANKLEMDYGSMPESHFQRSFRSKDEGARLRDHICKNMAPLIQARMSRIPTTPGSDWRDLPNTSVVLSDGNKSKILQYRHNDKKNGRAPSGALRGVCACAAGKPCDPADKQEYTLIPWCLPHTGNRHNNWAGLYGRIAWEGYFSTTVTDPEPMGKQGRILHPEQNRVVSVRECARSQGFPDTYMFAGSIQDKHRQVGNAVPPPLGAALGREIKKAFALRIR